MANSAQKIAYNRSCANSSPVHSNSASLTEIVLSGSNGIPDYNLVLPMLAHLSQQSQSKWFTWIAPTGISKAQLQSFGFNLNNVRIIHPKNVSDISRVFWEALTNNTSSTVIAETGSLTESDFYTLDTACKNTGCKGLLLRFR